MMVCSTKRELGRPGHYQHLWPRYWQGIDEVSITSEVILVPKTLHASREDEKKWKKNLAFSKMYFLGSESLFSCLHSILTNSASALFLPIDTGVAQFQSVKLCRPSAAEDWYFILMHRMKLFIGLIFLQT